MTNVAFWPEHAEASRGQADAAQPDASAWVGANAGSGKTKVLIDRVARLLLEGVAPDSILCVTYTKAAASEMQARLFERLGAWCVMDASRLEQELAKLEGGTDYPPARIGQARELFARALETPGGLRIETIHAFCGRVLRRFPLEAGVAPGFQELDDETAARIWQDAFLRLGARVVEGDRALMAAARLVAEAGADFSVLKALDSDRTRVLAFLNAAGGVERAIQSLRRTLAAPDLSSAQLMERAMGPDLPRGDLRRAAEALRRGGASDKKLAALLNAVLAESDAEDRFQVYRTVVFTKSGDLKRTVGTAAVLAAEPLIAALFSTSAPIGSETNRLLGVSEAVAAAKVFERSAALLRLADAVFSEFTRRKRARGGLDFDDLIGAVDRLLSRASAAEWVLWKLDGGIAHVLLDEAQDTSPDQWRILRKLTEDIFSGAGVERQKPRTLFVVGDQKQSIYSFQGADPEQFATQFDDVSARAAVAQIALNAPRLAMSFRSTPQVLTFVDDVFDALHFGGEAPFSIAPPSLALRERHTPFRRNEAGWVDLWPLVAPDPTPEADPWDAPIDQIKETSTKLQLARRIAAFIRHDIDTGVGVWDHGARRPAHAGDFLILVKGRTGGLFDALLQALKFQRLPVAGADRIQLLDSLAVQDLLNLIRFALCPEDDLTLAEILKGPFGGLTDEDLLELAWDRGEASLWSRLNERAEGKAQRALTFLHDLMGRRGDPPFEFLARALERPAGLERPGWEALLSRFGDPVREPVTALLDRAAAFDAGAAPSLQLFLAAVERFGGEVKRELTHAGDAVRVMTVHGAKGLQAPIVILPDTTSPPRLDKIGLFAADDGAPIWVGAKAGDTAATTAMRQAAEARARREHRRLLYVALTRAQDRLVVCGAWHGAKTGAGADKDSWYALCQRAMERLTKAGFARPVSEDDRDGLRLGERQCLSAPAPAERPMIAPPAWLDQDAPREAAADLLLAPSKLSRQEPAAAPPFGPGRAARLRRGRLIHTLFQSLPDLAPDRRRAAAMAFVARQGDLSGGEPREIVEAAMRVLEDPRLADLFLPGGRAEAPVIGAWEGGLVSGRIDRLIVKPDEIVVVDYKTDRPAPADVAGVDEGYLVQIGVYRHILSQAWRSLPIRCLLLWTEGPKLMEIPAADLDRALKRVRP